MRDVNFLKPNPGVGVVRLRVRAGGVERAFDRVCGAGDVGSAFDACECRRDQHQQHTNDTDDDEQFDERERADALCLRKLSGFTARRRPEAKAFLGTGCQPRRASWMVDGFDPRHFLFLRHLLPSKRPELRIRYSFPNISTEKPRRSFAFF